jgi:hypothetical protein
VLVNHATANTQINNAAPPIRGIGAACMLFKRPGWSTMRRAIRERSARKMITELRTALDKKCRRVIADLVYKSY